MKFTVGGLSPSPMSQTLNLPSAVCISVDQCYTQLKTAIAGCEQTSEGIDSKSWKTRVQIAFKSSNDALPVILQLRIAHISYQKLQVELNWFELQYTSGTTPEDAVRPSAGPLADYF
jgi:hypothetical protein